MSNIQSAPKIAADVTAIIPCYKAADTILRAVESIINQTLQVSEIILVDDASDDETPAILLELKRRYPDLIKLILLEKNQGVSDARNAAWDIASQPYIAFLDSDDAWHPKKIEIQYGYMVENPHVTLSGHSHSCILDPSLQPDWEIKGEGNLAKIISKYVILLSNKFVTPSVMLKMDVPFRFLTGKRYMEDHLLWAQIISSRLTVVKLPANLAAIYKFSYGVSGLSGQTMQMFGGEVDNYKQLYKENMLGVVALYVLIVFSYVKIIKRMFVIGVLMTRTKTAEHVANYMTLTYSITGLLVIMGLLGKHLMAADIAIVQGAALATFYVLSGDARHLILVEKSQANHVAFFRLIWVVPLCVLSYFMSVTLGGVEFTIALGLIVRRASEWLVEPHVTEIERIGSSWSGLYLQVLLFVLVVVEILVLKSRTLIWLWAVSPLFFSMRFLFQAKYNNFFLLGKSYLASTALMGFSNYAFRILVVELAGKTVAGMLFPAIAIGSFAGTLFANVAGSSLIKAGVTQSVLFKIALTTWSAMGFVIFIFSNSVFQSTLGLSVLGGGIMILAQNARLLLLKKETTLGLDTIVHLALIYLTPIIYSLGGSKLLVGIYLVHASLAWLFYNGSHKIINVSPWLKRKLTIATILMLIIPLCILYL
jgi:glycosyltransferase involved in cell wall biosynthesis